MEAFKLALELAHESQSGPAMAAVLISIGNAAGQRAMFLQKTGPRAAFEQERDACKRALLAAKDIYAHLDEEHEVANTQMNLANQIRFLGEVEEAKELVKVVIPIAEKYGDEDLLRKAKILEERLRTGRIPATWRAKKVHSAWLLCLGMASCECWCGYEGATLLHRQRAAGLGNASTS